MSYRFYTKVRQLGVKIIGSENLAEIFDQNPYMAVIVVNKEGHVIYVNKTYAEILKLPREAVLGKPIVSITPETKTVKVLETGKAVTAYNWSINGHHMVACAIPLFKENELTGCFAYSITMNIWDYKTVVEKLLSEISMLKDEVYKSHTARYRFDDIIGNDEKLLCAKLWARQVAHQSHTKVLITGESGTGKELFAHAIHNASARSMYPFVRVNCAAIPENLMEAELFGYEDGAFTGAKKGGRLGKFELADKGTIFLDEIGEMPLSMQSKLLVVLQEREIERLGGNSPIKINVRVISATNRDLLDMVNKGLFREDLYYRLNVVQIDVPALRHRKEDVGLLADTLLEKLNRRLKTSVTGFSPDALRMLEDHSWPGNVRELENAVERAVSLAYMDHHDILTRRHFIFLCNRTSVESRTGRKSIKSITQELEENLIARVMEETGSNKALAAEILEIDLSSLYRKLKKYKINLS